MLRPMIMRLTVTVSCVMLCYLSVISPGSAEDVVRFATWPAPAKNAGLVYAQEKGFFKKNGLENRLVEGYQNTVFLLQAGEAEIAQILCSSAVDAIQKGLPAKIIAVRDQRNPVATVSLRASGIVTPGDYSGRRWGHSPGFSPERAMLAYFAEKYGYRVEDVILINTEFPARLPALLNGDIDFFSAWLGSGLPVIQAAAAKAGQDIDVVRWEDAGAEIYGECYVARTDESGEVPEWVDGWLEAARAGNQTVYSSGNAGAQKLIRQSGQTVDSRIFQNALEQANELLIPVGGDESDILVMNEDKLRRTAEISGIEVKSIRELVYP